MEKSFQFHLVHHKTVTLIQNFINSEKNCLKNRMNIKDMSEPELIERARKQSKYFGVLYDRYFEQIFRFVFKRLGGLEDTAGDLTQQTFIKAMANLDRYEDRGFPFSSWLYRIAQNEVSMFFRKQKKQHFIPITENNLFVMAEEANIVVSSIREEQDILIEILNSLDSAQLDLIELRFFQQMSFKEIAEIYNISEANAKMRLYRILEKLSKKWNSKQ